MNTGHRQKGGTILGFIIGLIVGLGIAVVVAMVVTKTSIPFSNKQGNQGKISEPTASQAADPNKPLYGNNAAAKEAAKSFTKDDEPGVANAAKDDAKSKPDVKKDAKADAKKDVKPEDKAADKAKKADKDEKAAAAKEADKKDAKSDDKWTYYLQTNAYRDTTEAEGERAKLALTGFEARISETASQGNPLYRVRMGPFSNIDTMNRVRGKLTDSGINATVVRVPK